MDPVAAQHAAGRPYVVIDGLVVGPGFQWPLTTTSNGPTPPPPTPSGNRMGGDRAIRKPPRTPR